MARDSDIRPFAIREHKRGGKPTGRWQLDVPPHLSPNGKRKREMFDTKTAAEREAKQRLQRLAAGASPVTSMGQGLRSVSGVRFSRLAELWSEYRLRQVQLDKRSVSTFETNLHQLKPLLAVFGNDDIALIDETRLEEYQGRRLKEGRRPRTINSEVGTLKVVLGWAKKERLVSAVPEVEHLPSEEKIVDLPTPEEVARIIAELPQRLRVLVLALAETGCRKRELFGLPWEDVDEMRGIIWIRPHRERRIKNRQSIRSIPISDQLLGAIRELDKDGFYVFPGRKEGKPIDNFRKALKTAVKDAGVERNGKPMHLTPHMFRKAYATWQAERGVEETTLQTLMGHARGSKVTRKVYVNPQDEARRKAVFELPMAGQDENDEAKSLATSGNKSQLRPRGTK
jgi:integrase